MRSYFQQLWNTMQNILVKNIEILQKLWGVDVTGMSQDEYRKAAVEAVKKLSQDVGIPADLKEIVKVEDLDFFK